MSTSRREFLGALPAGVALSATMTSGATADELSPARKGYRIEDIRRELRREGRPADVTKDDLPTPALILDLDVFEANLRRMATHAKTAGVSLRPHAKTHKCVQIARRQIAAGALGVCVATAAEAEVMVAGNVRGVLLTSPIASPHEVAWIMRLVEIAPHLRVVVDHAEQIKLY